MFESGDDMTVDRTRAGIIGVGSYVPELVVPNEIISAGVGARPGWIEERTGVLERRHAAPHEATSDLAAAAAFAALDSAGLTPLDVDVIVAATSTPDHQIPGVACLVQQQIGASLAAAFDVDSVCTGFMYALEVARSILVANPTYNHILVVGADTYSRILDPADRRTFPLFGDGAGAVVLGCVTEDAELDPVVLGSDGNLAHYVQIPAGGSRRPLTARGLATGEQYFKMLGREVRELVEDTFPKLVDRVCGRRGLRPHDIDHLICHQANVRLISACAQYAGFRPDQLVVTGDLFGNTAAASIPLGLDTAVRDGRVRAGDVCLFIGFGGGMSWAGTTARMPEFVSSSMSRAVHRDLVGQPS
jgi:acetoacetyl-CoA synthase